MHNTTMAFEVTEELTQDEVLRQLEELSSTYRRQKSKKAELDRIFSETDKVLGYMRMNTRFFPDNVVSVHERTKEALSTEKDFYNRILLLKLESLVSRLRE
jgi:cell shape-determining protein MreC